MWWQEVPDWALATIGVAKMMTAVGVLLRPVSGQSGSGIRVLGCIGTYGADICIHFVRERALWHSG